MIYKNYLKRAFDIALSATAVSAMAIPIAVTAAFNAVYLRENPFYLVDRSSIDRKPFKMIKLKSMRTLTDESGNLLPDDQRRTSFGKLLRHTGVDELPQFINVLKGDMSIVGPRPMGDWDLDHMTEEERASVLSVRPGLTGPWQVSAIGTLTTLQEKHERNASYAREPITFAKDVSYMVRTISSFWHGHDNKP